MSVMPRAEIPTRIHENMYTARCRWCCVVIIVLYSCLFQTCLKLYICGAFWMFSGPAGFVGRELIQTKSGLLEDRFDSGSWLHGRMEEVMCGCQRGIMYILYYQYLQ